MRPTQGAGAGQAIEDAYILASILADAHTTLSNLPTALKIYEEIRLPRGNDVIARSRKNGRLFEFTDSQFHHFRNTVIQDGDSAEKERFQDYVKVIVDNWEWAWTTTPVDDLERALKLLQERVSSSK